MGKQMDTHSGIHSCLGKGIPVAGPTVRLHYPLVAP